MHICMTNRPKAEATRGQQWERLAIRPIMKLVEIAGLIDRGHTVSVQAG